MMAAAKAAAFGALLVALCGAGAPPAAATGVRALLDGHEGSNYTEMANMTDMMGNMTDMTDMGNMTEGGRKLLGLRELLDGHLNATMDDMMNMSMMANMTEEDHDHDHDGDDHG